MSRQDHPVFIFPSERARNETGRALRQAGFRCFGTGPTATEVEFVLTLDEESVNGRCGFAIALVYETCPDVTRRS